MNKFKRPSVITSLIISAALGILLSTATFLFADHSDHEEKKFRGKQSNALRDLPKLDNMTWREECSSCHTLFQPGFLPARSWEKIMQGLADHFGDDASVDPEINVEITKFLVAHASDKQESRRTAKINRSISLNDSPLRITETLYFKKKHDEISSQVFKRQKIGTPSNCVACHGQGAEDGVFDEELVSIPKGSNL